jgi:hypothetical protein|tara:strand:+ start:511 stop:1002 length:492 start_codon:yes stop_codon:yes gene_type:complete
MKDERYNIFVISSEGVNLDGVSSIEYSYDWGMMPEGEYELTWALSSQNKVSTLAQAIVHDCVALQFVGLNAYTSQTANSVISGTNTSSQIIGLIEIGSQYHYTDTDKFGVINLVESRNNPPIRVRSVPQGKFIINLLKSDGTLALASSVDEYVLSLGFRRLEC